MLASVEVGYSLGSGELDSDRWAASAIDETRQAWWISVQPFAWAEPAMPVYEVTPPPLEYLTFQLPVKSEPEEEVPLEKKPWWYRLSEVRGLLMWIGAGLLAGVTALAAKLGWDKRKR